MYGGVYFSPHRPDAENVARIDHGALPMILDMHRYGIRVDKPFLASLTTRFNNRRAEIQAEVAFLIGGYQYSHPKTGLQPFKIGSPDHVSQLLFEHMQVQGGSSLAMTKKRKRFTTSDEALAPFSKAYPVVGLILEDRGLGKLVGTYTLPLQQHADADSRSHTTFNPTVAATGRLSSSKPVNLQTIPVRSELGKLIRAAFISSPGCDLVSVDLAQIEMVWAAHRSQDPVMMDVFRRGQDVHTRTACEVFGEDYEAIMALSKVKDDPYYKDFKQTKRLPCKTVGFGVLYGQTAKGLVESLAADGVYWLEAEGQAFIDDKFFGVYAGLKSMLERDWAQARRYAMVWDGFGRVRLVPEAKSVHKRIAEEGIRKAGNHFEQSGAQGGLKLGMAEVNVVARELNKEPGTICRPLLQIHDQLIFEVSKPLSLDFGEYAKYVLEQAVRPFTVPIRSSLDVAERWADL